MTRGVLIQLSVLGCLVAFFGGCGETGPDLCPVTGTVIYQGGPVEDAVVAFRGEAATKLATGRTDAEGRFELTTFEDGDGAVAGKHQVTVSKFVVEGPGTSGPVSMDEAAENPQPQAESRNFLPAKYADPARPLIELTVSEDGPNDFTIELSD